MTDSRTTDYYATLRIQQGRIKSAIEDLTKEMHARSTILYQQQAQQQQAQQGGQAGQQEEGKEEKKDEKVTDAEYKVVDDEKK